MCLIIHIFHTSLFIYADICVTYLLDEICKIHRAYSCLVDTETFVDTETHDSILISYKINKLERKFEITYFKTDILIVM